MKQALTFLLFLAFGIAANCQLKTSPICPAFYVDILDGKVNDLVPSSTFTQIKEKLPCFTSAEAEGPEARCGGGVFFKDKDIYFFTARDYVEIGPKFSGKLSMPLMGANRNNLFKLLGLPKIKDINWDAFTTQYGTLVLYYNKLGKVNKLQFSTQRTETLQLCDQ